MWTVLFDSHLLTFLHWHIFAFVVYLSTGEWVLTPIPEHWPGRREAEPFHQRQLGPRLQCLPELLCCDRYNLTHARLTPKRINTAAGGRGHLQQGARTSCIFPFCFMTSPQLSSESFSVQRKQNISNILCSIFPNSTLSPLISQCTVFQILLIPHTPDMKKITLIQSHYQQRAHIHTITAGKADSS